MRPPVITLRTPLEDHHRGVRRSANYLISLALVAEVTFVLHRPGSQRAHQDGVRLGERSAARTAPRRRATRPAEEAAQGRAARGCSTATRHGEQLRRSAVSGSVTCSARRPRIGERELDEGAEIRFEIADVEPALLGAERHAVDAPAVAHQPPDRIGQLNLPADAGRGRASASRIAGDRT